MPPARPNTTTADPRRSTLVDVLLLIALFSRWHADRGRAWAREQRHAGALTVRPG